MYSHSVDVYALSEPVLEGPEATEEVDADEDEDEQSVFAGARRRALVQLKWRLQAGTSAITGAMGTDGRVAAR